MGLFTSVVVGNPRTSRGATVVTQDPDVRISLTSCDSRRHCTVYGRIGHRAAVSENGRDCGRVGDYRRLFYDGDIDYGSVISAAKFRAEDCFSQSLSAIFVAIDSAFAEESIGYQ